MKRTAVVAKSLVIAGCVTLLGMGAGHAGQPTADRGTVYHPAPVKQRVVLVRVTGSLIPQRVVLRGNNVDSASPLYVMQGNDLLRSGSSDISGILRTDPSVTFRRR
jgi:hypothetical protein